MLMSKFGDASFGGTKESKNEEAVAAQQAAALDRVHVRAGVDGVSGGAG